VTRALQEKQWRKRVSQLMNESSREERTQEKESLGTGNPAHFLALRLKSAIAATITKY
jgi:hypothetical protein